MSKEIKLPAVIEKFIAATNDHNGKDLSAVLLKMPMLTMPPGISGERTNQKMERQGNDR